MKKINMWFGVWLLAVIVLSFSLPRHFAQAAALTSVKDTMSTLAASANANHEIDFTTPTGIAAGNTVTLTFPSGFSLTSVDFADVDVEDDNVDVTLAATCSGATYGLAVSGQVMTLTSCTGTMAAGSIVTFEIGTNATAGGSGVDQIDNPTAANYVISVGGTMTDSGSFAVSIIADDSVNVTSTVPTALTFTISDTTIGFGDLLTSGVRYATGDLSGTGTFGTAAHTFTVATNATNGYAITYNGATLTSGANTVDVADINDDNDGTPGTEQFAFGVTTTGDGTIATDYNANSTAEYKFVAGTTTSFFSEAVPTATETISAYYLANISGTTQAGTYTTNVTYIATGVF